MYKPFWTKKIWPGWQGGSGKVQILPNMGLIFGFWALKRPLNGSRTPEMDPKWSPQLPLIDLSPFPGSWTHLGASRGLRSQKRGPYLAIFGPSLTPPANPVKFFWSKMACTGVPHIVLHVSCRTRTSGGYFWPSEVRFRGILALSRDWFYNGQKNKMQISQNPLMGGFWSLGI